MSKFEPTYTCNLCQQLLYADEVSEHTDGHIEDGILEEIFTK